MGPGSSHLLGNGGGWSRNKKSWCVRANTVEKGRVKLHVPDSLAHSCSKAEAVASRVKPSHSTRTLLSRADCLSSSSTLKAVWPHLPLPLHSACEPVLANMPAPWPQPQHHHSLMSFLAPAAAPPAPGRTPTLLSKRGLSPPNRSGLTSLSNLHTHAAMLCLPQSPLPPYLPQPHPQGHPSPAHSISTLSLGSLHLPAHPFPGKLLLSAQHPNKHPSSEPWILQSFSELSSCPDQTQPPSTCPQVTPTPPWSVTAAPHSTLPDGHQMCCVPTTACAPRAAPLHSHPS